MSNQIEIRGTWSAPRWAGVSSALKQGAHMAGITCTVDVDKGWIREEARFVLSGEAEKVRAVYNGFCKAIEEYDK
jgi:hypothetical protein